MTTPLQHGCDICGQHRRGVRMQAWVKARLRRYAGRKTASVKLVRAAREEPWPSGKAAARLSGRV